MKNNKNLKHMIYASAAAALFTVMVLPVSATGKSALQTGYEAIRLIINGQTIHSKDAAGNELAPKLIEGNLYVPVQAVASALNTQYAWDEGQNTLTMTSSTVHASQDETGMIGIKKAKEIALAHAGLSEADVIFYKAELDWDDGIAEYEIEFYANSIEYDYNIDSKTGVISDWDHDAEGYNIPNKAPSAKVPAADSNDIPITLEAAKAMALEKAPGATLVSCKLDYDDGQSVYEGELKSGRTEYEFEIDAVSGSFLKWEVDQD